VHAAHLGELGYGINALGDQHPKVHALTRTGHIQRTRLSDSSEIGDERRDMADLAIDRGACAGDHPTGALSMSQQSNLTADHHQRIAEIMCEHGE
jgi:hypothetical protein